MYGGKPGLSCGAAASTLSPVATARYVPPSSGRSTWGAQAPLCGRIRQRTMTPSEGIMSPSGEAAALANVTFWVNLKSTPHSRSSFRRGPTSVPEHAP